MRTTPLLLAGLAAALALSCGPNQTHPPPSAFVPGAALPLTCVPNLDGQIDANELSPALGIPETFLVSPPGGTRTVDLAGATDANGHLTWDFSTSYSDDGAISVQATALGAQWYAASFPGGEFVLPSDAADTIEAVYSHDDKSMLLYGLASKDPMPANGKTLFVYSPPVTVYEFPFHPGSTWTSVGNVANGTLDGLPYAAKDTYVTTDDATGVLVLSDLTFTQVHRVRTTLTNEPSVGATSTTKQVSFIFECFAEVARATSQPNEPNDNFTTAAALRRLGVTPN